METNEQHPPEDAGRQQPENQDKRVEPCPPPSSLEDAFDLAGAIRDSSRFSVG